MDEIIALAGSNGRKSARTARGDEHSFRDERTTRDRSALIGVGVNLRGQGFHVIQCVGRFMKQCASTPFAHDQMAFDPRLLQNLQRTYTEDSSRGAGHTDNQSHNDSSNSFRTSFRQVRSVPMFGLTQVIPATIYAPGSRTGSASSTST